MKIDLKKSALVIVDMQKDFYGDGGSAVKRGKPVTQMQSIVVKINLFSRFIREQGGKVMFTKFLHDPAKSPANFAEILSSNPGAVNMCIKGSAGSAIDGVNVDSVDTVIEKYTYDPFTNPELKNTLKKFNTETIVIAGVRTEICVQTTAIRSFTEGFRVIVLSDLVATYDDLANFHEFTLNNLKYHSYIIESDALLQNI